MRSFIRDTPPDNFPFLVQLRQPLLSLPWRGALIQQKALSFYFEHPRIWLSPSRPGQAEEEASTTQCIPAIFGPSKLSRMYTCIRR